MARIEQPVAAQHTDSLEPEHPDDASTMKKQKSRKPPNTAFRQQRLKAWQPILTPKTVLPLFFVVGVIFAPIGGLLLWASSQVQEIAIDYTDCAKLASGGDYQAIPSSKISNFFKSNEADTTTPMWKLSSTERVYYSGGQPVKTPLCSLQFRIPDDMHPPVLFYYRLTNFYQNHRRYVKSLNTNQLKGDAVSASDINSSPCDPLKLDPASGLPYYPCGLIANSIFNDTFHSPVLINASGGNNSSNSSRTYPMTSQGIAWPADKNLYGKTQYSPDQIAPPPNWVVRYPNWTAENLIDIHTDEAFQVWMRTAGLPNFAKLALRNDTAPLTAGNYQVDVEMNFPVDKYGGTKSIVITTRTVMGGRNPFLGIAYVVVAGICVLLGTAFLAAHLIKPRKLGDHTYLTWNNETSSADQGRTTGASTGMERFGAENT